MYCGSVERVRSTELSDNGIRTLYYVLVHEPGVP